jgi:hypothetical protein
MKYKRHKKLIYFAGISILLSLIGYYFVSKDIYPYELVKVSDVQFNPDVESYLIEDLDENGYSEQIIIRNLPEEKIYYIVLIEHSEKISRTKNILNQSIIDHHAGVSGQSK